MAVVVDLDPLRRFGQVEEVGHLAQQLGLRRRLGQPPVECLDRVALRLIEQTAAIAPLRHGELYLVSRPLAQRLGQQLTLGQVAVEQDRLGGRHFLVELHEEAGQHLLLGHIGGVRGEEAAMPPILAAADEKGLDAHHPLATCQREDVGVAHPFGIDRLRPLDEGQRLQPVAQDRGQFEVHRLGRRLHLGAQLGLDLGRLPAEEVLRIGDQFGIGGLVDPADARRRAALDLVEQARPVAPLEEAVGAGAEQEQLLQRVQRVVDAARTGERAVIIADRTPGPAMLLDARKVMVVAQQDEGKALVVAQQDVEGRAVALDQLGLEQQRLGLVVGRDDGHRPGLRDHALQALRQAINLGVVGDAVLQRAGLADIQDVTARILHPVHAGPKRQRRQHVADRRHPRLQIGRIGTAQGEGGFLFVEAVDGRLGH